MKIVLATNNMHKLREFRTMLQSAPHIEIVTLRQFPDYEAPEETGVTFEENAIIKAVHAAHHLNCWALADDSGLAVPSLGGAPGVYSRRYASDNATDAENTKKLLEELKGHTDLQRSAYYECALALAGPKGLHKVVSGKCEGYIADQEQGNKGFGYDPVFIKHDYGKTTFGQLDERVKNQISHRYKALEKMLLVIQSLEA